MTTDVSRLSTENKIGLIPSAIVQGGTGGMRHYGIVVTEKRSIFVLEKGVSAWATGAVGALAADALSTRKSIDYTNLGPEDLARMDKSISIPHDSVTLIRLRKGFWRAPPQLQIEYNSPEGKHKKIKARLEPPSAFMKQKKSEGVGRKQALLEYAGAAKDVYRKTLSATQSVKADWQL